MRGIHLCKVINKKGFNMVSSQSILHILQQSSLTIIMWQYVYKFCVTLTYG